jgi:hypothetical protein
MARGGVLWQDSHHGRMWNDGLAKWRPLAIASAGISPAVSRGGEPSAISAGCSARPNGRTAGNSPSTSERPCPIAVRDHWASAGVALLAGGGVKGGQVVGQTNANAEFVTDSPVYPQDLAATIYHSLGVPLHTWYKTPDGRLIDLVPTGKPVKQLITI